MTTISPASQFLPFSRSPQTSPLQDRFAPLPSGTLDFDATLQKAGAPTRTDSRQAAEELVATTFIEPMLAEMRKSPFGDSPLAGTGPVQDRLSGFADGAIARDIVRGARIPLIDAIQRTLSEGASSQSKLAASGALS